MKKRLLSLALLSAVAGCASHPGPAGPGGPIRKPVESTPADRVSASLTVHNQDLAIVRETRKIALRSGRQEIRFLGVSDRIVPESVQARRIRGPGALDFMEQNFDALLLTPARALEKAVGGPVRAWIRDPSTGEETLVSGRLVSVEGGAVVDTGQGFREIPWNARIEIDRLAEPPRTVPVLSWMGVVEASGEYEVAALYQTRGMSWRADYVLDVGREARVADLQAWATIRNDTMLAVEASPLQLLAGDVQRAVDWPGGESPPEAMAIADASAARPPREEPLLEYHLYTVERPVSVGARQAKQITLTRATDVPIRLSHRVRLGLGAETVERLPTSVRISVEHVENGPLAVPLPAGSVRVWTTDPASGQRVHLAEATVEHTPVGEPLEADVPGDPVLRASWIPSRARWDEEGAFLVEGRIALTSSSRSPIDAELAIECPDEKVAVIVDGAEIEREGPRSWKTAVRVEPGETSEHTVRTRR